MENYFDDLKFRIVLHHWLDGWRTEPMVTESNSFEFIPSGHLVLERAGRQIQLDAPVCFWLKERESFRFVTQNGEKTEHLYVDFSGPRSNRMLAALDAMFPGGAFHPVDTVEMRESFLHLLRLYRSDPVLNHPDMVALMETMLALGFRAVRGGEDRAADPYELKALASQLRGEPFADYDFEKIARDREITSDHLRRIFREKFDRTPREYLARERMLRAAEMLRGTKMRIKEIQFTCRFASAIDFTRTFKKFSGVSPRAYREQDKNP